MLKLIINMSMIVFLSLALNCTAQQVPQHNQPEPQAIESSEPKINVGETTYYIYKDGAYQEAELSQAPELIGGSSLMETLIRLNIHYPKLAREQKIGGTVLVTVVIDAEGNMEDSFIHEGIGGGCNDEALAAVRLLDQTGFTPGEMRGKPFKVKYDIPISFLPR